MMSHHCFLLHISRMKADRNIISSVPGPLDMSSPWAMSISQTLGGLSEQISPLIAGFCLKCFEKQKRLKKGQKNLRFEPRFDATRLLLLTPIAVLLHQIGLSLHYSSVSNRSPGHSYFVWTFFVPGIPYQRQDVY